MNVIVPTFGRPEMLAELLALLARQTVTPRVIIVDDGGSDAFPAHAFPVVWKHLWTRHTGFNVAARLNEGLAACDGETAIIIADDCLPLSPGWVEAHARALCSAPFSLGPIQYKPDEDPRVMGFSNANLAFDVYALRELGGFDEAYCGGYGYEDSDLGMRIAQTSLKIAMPGLPAAVIHRGLPYAGGDRSAATTGRNQALYEQKWGWVK